jgi:hypothetical protein
VLSLAAMALAVASATNSPPLTSVAPWWEKITVTISADGSQRSCRYETNLAGKAGEGCEAASAPADIKRASGKTDGTQTKITFERRFTPNQRPDFGDLSAGDTLLGGQVMMLAIDGEGAVRACEVVAESGDSKPAYSCDQVRGERFQASARRGAGEARLGYMTVLVYGHEEQVA